MKVFEINASKKSMIVFSVLVFIVMLVFNCMTPYLADDYIYRYSFEDAALIESVMQIPMSMYHHSKIMNGRVISHGFEQLFMTMPKIVFNVVNSIVFTACMYLMYRMCMGRKKDNLCIFGAIVVSAWLFTPAFGQVYLWQVGAVNYLWALFFAMVFLSPYIDNYKNKTPVLKNNIVFVLFCIFALLLGMYSEVASFIAIMVAVGVVVAARFMCKQKITLKKVLPIVFAVIGFVLLLMMPVEMSAKVSDGLTLDKLLENFGACTIMLEKYFIVPIIVWAVLIVVSLYMKKGYKSIVLSLILAFCAVCANYVMIIGAYIPERSLFVAAALFIMADIVLAADVIKTSYGVWVSAGAAVLAVCFVFSFVHGAYDIYNCYDEFTDREEYIINARDAGETDLVVPIVKPDTMHSPFWGVVDLNCESTQQWPNVTVAWYYGINSILGCE